MNAATFQTLIKNSSVLNAEEVNELRDWGAQFPYCQVIHLLLARGARDLKATDAEALLHRAAVYAGDRTVVKSVMLAPAGSRTVVPVIKPPKPAPAADVAEKAPEPQSHMRLVKPAPPAAPVPPRETITLEGDDLRADLSAELNRLHHLMHAFEASYEQLKHHEETPAPAPAPKPTKKSAAPKAPPAEPTEPPLIEEIKSSKRKPKLVSPKVAEQGEIIDHFIKVAPSLPRTKPTESSADLAAESVNYGDHIVSETLVEILLKQGKKAKAIEMLKKLIWKFPQKKAYFAAQIEALKS